MSVKIDNQLIKVEDFLAANNLKLNISKTQVLRTASRQQIVGNKGENVMLEAVDDKGKKIVPSNSAKILGITFNKSLIWRDYLEAGKEAMVSNLKRKLGALKFTSKFASYNTRVKLANGCIMSKIIYGIQVWGLHCRPSLLKKVQSLQYNTMKWVTGKYNDSLTDQLTATGWLSVYQLAVYHSLVLYWKVTFHNKPIRLITRINIARETEARIQLTERIWSRTSERLFRRVENYLIGVTKISSAKNILRKWVKSNIPISEE